MGYLPEISVIVPVYKAEKVLSRCIDSILNQSYRNFELLLIDDGSPDHSGQICDEYLAKDARIRVFHKKNGGVSSARNCGLKEAVGNYLFFVDSDDWIDADFFSTVSRYFGQYDMFFFGGQMVTNEGKLISVLKPENMNTEVNTLSDIVYSMFRIGLLGYALSMAMKRSIIIENQILFKEGVSIHEDSLFCYASLYKAKKVISLDLLFYKYVVYTEGNTSLSNRVPDNYSIIALERIHQMENLLSYLQMPQAQQSYILNSLKHWAWTKCLDWASVQSDRIAAVRYIQKQLSTISNYSATTVKGMLLQKTIRMNNPYLLLLSKRISKFLVSK